MTSEPLHEDRARASSFGDDPRQYDRARPSYPTGLLDHLLEHGPRTALDVGCGTGIASRQLAERGLSVLGVEPDPRMAALARESGIDVEVSDFERWDAKARSFELVCSAQAWHWVDPEAGSAKAGEIVVPGGTVAFFWNVGRPTERQRQAFDACYRRFAPGLEQYSVLLGRGGPERFTTAAAALGREGRFREIETASFAHAVSYTSAQWLEHLETHSDHRALEQDVRDALFSEIAAVIDADGGTFDLSYEAVCVRARRV